MRAAQAVLAASAILVIAFGLLVMLQTVRWTHYVGLLVWLAAAVVLHDAVLVPVVTGLRAALQARARRLPAGAVVVLQGAFVVGAVLSLAVLPEVWAQHLGTRNPTVLPVDYLARLAVVWAVLLAVGLVAVLAGTARERRRLRPLGAPGEKVGPPRARPAGAP